MKKSFVKIIIPLIVMTLVTGGVLQLLDPR